MSIASYLKRMINSLVLTTRHWLFASSLYPRKETEAAADRYVHRLSGSVARWRRYPQEERKEMGRLKR